MMQVCPDTESQPFQLPNVEPELGVAVTLTALPLAKLAVQVVAQSIPAGVLTTLPEPVPAAKSTVSAGPDPPEPAPVKQDTLACISPVTIAPVDDMFPSLEF